VRAEEIFVTVQCAGGGKRPGGVPCWFTGDRQTVDWRRVPLSDGQPKPVDPVAKPCPRCDGRVELAPKEAKP
jgi:hypothetical protein